MKSLPTKIARARNNKLIFYTLLIYAFLAFNILGTGGCKWNSDYRGRVQPNAETEALSAEESSLQDAINEREPESLKSAVPTKPMPAISVSPDMPS